MVSFVSPVLLAKLRLCRKLWPNDAIKSVLYIGEHDRCATLNELTNTQIVTDGRTRVPHFALETLFRR
jgi:hypothetical protein